MSGNGRNTGKHILLTFDVEDWFQVENLKPVIPFASWPQLELRVEQNTHTILDLLDTIEECNGTQPIRATFFVLGWVAKRVPDLVREIQARGHEIASHGNHHELCSRLSDQELKNDIRYSKNLLEDIISAPIHGYRAPSFSVSERVLRSAKECGYLYDSSYNSFGGNSRYGRIRLPCKENDHSQAIAYQVLDDFYELPIGNIQLLSRTIPWGGGGYFRLLPPSLFKIGLRQILNRQNAYVFYLHPWEVDPGQPRVDGLSRMNTFRHYLNLGKTLGRLLTMIKMFKDCAYESCCAYLSQAQQQR